MQSYIILILLYYISFCHINYQISDEKMINELVTSLDTIDFNYLKNKVVEYRNQRYLFGVVSNDKKTEICSVVEINNKEITFVTNDCLPDVFSEENIKKALNMFIQHKLNHIMIDNNGNIYVGKWNYSLVKRVSKSPPRFVNNSTYKHYKSNWYIKETR